MSGSPKWNLKESRDIHWVNFALRKSWLDYSIFVSFFVLSVCKNRLFPKGLGLDPSPVFRGCQLFSVKPTMAGDLH